MQSPPLQPAPASAPGAPSTAASSSNRTADAVFTSPVPVVAPAAGAAPYDPALQDRYDHPFPAAAAVSSVPAAPAVSLAMPPHAPFLLPYGLAPPQLEQRAGALPTLDPRRQDSYDQFKQFLGLDKDAAAFPHASSPGALAVGLHALPAQTPSLPVASGMTVADVSPRSSAPVACIAPPPPNGGSAFNGAPRLSIGLDRLTFSFDPSGADLAPLVLAGGQPVFTSPHPLSQSAPPPLPTVHVAMQHRNSVDVLSRMDPHARLVSPVSPRGSSGGQWRPQPYSLDIKAAHKRSPSSTSDRSALSTAVSPISGTSTTPPNPLTHSPISTVGSERSRPESATGSPASQAPSVLSPPQSASGTSASRRGSRWSTSDAGLAEMSLADKPIQNFKVTTAKTKAASVSRRKAAAPFKCPVPGCESSFTRALNLRGHLRSHTDERPYSCRYCERSFARAHDKRRHEKLHLNIRPHTCECCGKMFARLDALNRHHRQDGDTCVPRAENAASPASSGPVPVASLPPGRVLGPTMSWPGSQPSYGPLAHISTASSPLAAPNQQPTPELGLQLYTTLGERSPADPPMAFVPIVPEGLANAPAWAPRFAGHVL